MRSLRLLSVCLLAGAAAHAATDPFMGTWSYSANKSPKPTIGYKIKDLGGDRYALTGSSGTTTEIKADGVFIKASKGEKVAFKKLDDHTWQMIRWDPDKMVRTYTVSSDDKTLTLVDKFTLPGNRSEKTVTAYARVSPGRSIYGEWQSVSMKDDMTGDPGYLRIAPYGHDGVTLTSSMDKDQLNLNFDGKAYTKTGPTAQKNETTSAKRVNPHLLLLDTEVNGVVDSKEEWKVSDDGKVLTITTKPVKSSAVFTNVFDKK